jgi:hypothetical protein
MGLRRLLSARPSPRTPPWWLELLFVAWLCTLYDLLTNEAPVRRAAAIAHGRALLHVEQLLHVSPELTLTRWMARHHTLALVAATFYDNAHFVVTFGVLAWLWWRHPDAYRPLRTALVLTNVIAFAVFLLDPTAPPRLIPGSGFVDVVAQTHAIGSWHTGALAHDADQYAAMPSLHLAWAWWSAVAVWRCCRWRAVRALAALYPPLVTIAVLGTGNHYLLDTLAGAATLALALALRRLPLWRAAGAGAARVALEWRTAVASSRFGVRLRLRQRLEDG